MESVNGHLVVELEDRTLGKLRLVVDTGAEKTLLSAKVAEKGKVDLFHWFIYHGYEFNPDRSYQNVEELKATLAKYSAKAKMRQGENGCPSELTTKFALPDAESAPPGDDPWNRAFGPPAPGTGRA